MCIVVNIGWDISLYGAMPLLEPVLTYCQLDSREQTSVKCQSEFIAFFQANALENIVWNTVVIPRVPYSIWLGGKTGLQLAWFLRTLDSEHRKHYPLMHPSTTLHSVTHWTKSGYQVSTLHMPRQLSCRGMCKFVTWTVSLEYKLNKKIFHKISIMSS